MVGALQEENDLLKADIEKWVYIFVTLKFTAAFYFLIKNLTCTFYSSLHLLNTDVLN